MEYLNYMGEPVTIIDKKLIDQNITEEEAKKMDMKKYIHTYFPLGNVNLEMVNQYKLSKGKSVVIYNTLELPPQEDNVYYIVNKKILIASDRKDLVTPVGEVKAQDGQFVGYTDFIYRR